MAQPKMGVVRWMLGETHYPDNSYTREKDNSPIRPYDMSTDTMTEFMGVKSDPVGEAVVTGNLVKLTAALQPAGKVTKGSAGYTFDGRLNDAFTAVNLLLDKGVAVRRVDHGLGFTPGDFVVAAAPDALVAEIAKHTGVDFKALNAAAPPTSHDVKRQRIAMYQRYNGGNSDEGWTQFTLEQFHFPSAALMDTELKAGNLNAKYDVIVLPSDSTAALTGERPAAGAPSANTGSGRGGGGGEGGGGPQAPPEFRSGFGREGVDALRAFVQKGGTLLTFGGAGAFPIERLGIPVRNVLAGKSSKEFWCPGSTLRTRFDVNNPLTYGMPALGLATFLADSQAYETIATDHSERIETLATFAERDILQSGWLLGEELLSKKAAALSVRMGQGRVVLIGFRAQHRAQTHGTYKIVFNALIEGSAVPAARATTDQAGVR